MLSWLERLPDDESLQAFVAAEIARAGIELDTLRYQHGVDRQRVAALTAELDAAHAELKTLRRRLGQRRRRLVDLDGAEE